MAKLRDGQRVMFRLDSEHRLYPVREGCPKDDIWIINTISPPESRYPFSQIAGVCLESNYDIRTTCYVDRLEDSFLVQVQLAIERGNKKKNAKRKLSAA